MCRNVLPQKVKEQERRNTFHSNVRPLHFISSGSIESDPREILEDGSLLVTLHEQALYIPRSALSDLKAIGQGNNNSDK